MQGYHSGAAGTVGQNVYIGNCTNISWYETNMNASGFVSAAQNCLTSGNYTAGVPATGINWIVLNATDYVNGTWLTGTSEKNLTLFINRTGNAIGAGTRNVQANILTIGLRTGTAASSEDQFNSTEATDGKSLPTLVVYYKVYQDGTKQVNYRNVIENNTFFNITGSAIRIDQSSFANVSGNLINNSWNGNAIFGQYTHNATIYNNSIFDSSLYGFICDNCSQNNVTNNTFQNSSQSNTVKVGVRLTNDSKKNQIWNNLFNLSNWSFQNSKNENYFNSTPTTAKGKNIVGNTSIAGNAWTNITGDGYSNTCTDGNNDGICDNNFNITTNDTAFKSYDKSPLKITGVSVVNPCSCPTADTNWNLRNAICLLNTFCDIQDGNTTLENSSLKIEYPGSLNCYSISWNETDSNITWNEATTNLSWRSG
jgi:parallel beta-helix repeat protein